MCVIDTELSCASRRNVLDRHNSCHRNDFLKNTQAAFFWQLTIGTGSKNKSTMYINSIIIISIAQLGLNIWFL